MLKNSNVEVVYSIERYMPDAKNKFIVVEIATGNIIDGVFISDNRGLIKHSIRNIPNRSIQKIESLIVDINGQVTLSLIPVDNNDLEVNGASQSHITGQLVDCSGYSENDEVNVAYYYIEAGRDWFNEAAVFVADDNPEFDGLNDYAYNSKRLWSILLQMELVSGDIV